MKSILQTKHVFYQPEFQLFPSSLYILLKLNLRRPDSSLAASLTTPGYLKRLEN